MVHKCLYGAAPSSLTDMLTYASSTRTKKLVQYPYKGSFGNRSFVRTGPKLWNILPPTIRLESDVMKFKTALKTYLFDGFEGFTQKLNEC